MKMGRLNAKSRELPGTGTEMSAQFKKDGAQYIIIGNCSDCSKHSYGVCTKMKLKSSIKLTTS